jgi:hypothetical protein
VCDEDAEEKQRETEESNEPRELTPDEVLAVLDASSVQAKPKPKKHNGRR